MEYKKKPLMSGDCLAITRVISIDIFNHNMGKIMVKTLLIIHTCSMLVHFQYFFKTLDLEPLIPYISMFCWTITGNLSLLLLLIKPVWAINMRTEMKFWPENSAGERLEKKIKRESIFASLFGVITLILSLATTIALSFNGTEAEENVSLIIKLLSENRIFLVTDVIFWIYKLSFVLFVYVMTLCLLEDYLANLTRNQKFNEEMILEDDIYQNLVEKRLKFCVERYNQIFACGNRMTKKISILLPVFALATLSHGIGCSIFIYAYRPYGIVRSIMPAILYLGTAAGIILAGQQVEEHMEKLIEALMSNPWYTWNVKNRKLLLTAMLGLVQPSTVKFTEKISLNYNLGISILKGIFSAASVFIQTRTR